MDKEPGLLAAHWEIIVGVIGYFGSLIIMGVSLGKTVERISVLENHIVKCNPISEATCLEYRHVCQSGNCERRDRISDNLNELKESHINEIKEIKLLISEVRKENADYNKAVMGHLVALNGRKT